MKRSRLEISPSPFLLAEDNGGLHLTWYETKLGNLDKAKLLLKACFNQDLAYREGALVDPDLVPLWAFLAGR